MHASHDLQHRSEPISVSKKVDDLGHHESRHTDDPKHNPRLAPRPSSEPETPPAGGRKRGVPAPAGAEPKPTENIVL
jgi:hypothetical protein